MNLFYAKPGDIHLPEITIRDQEAKHITKVLRYTNGDQLQVTDGLGSKYICEIDRISGNLLVAKVIETIFEKRKQPIVTLCMGIIKKRDRLEFGIEKATELGVDEIIIFNGDHSQKQKVRIDRLTATAISAMKQSMRTYLPGISAESSLQKALSSKQHDAILITADENKGGDEHFKPDGGQNFIIVVGPEGGFSENERKFLADSGALFYSLGEKRLRTETAAIIMVDRLKMLKF